KGSNGILELIQSAYPQTDWQPWIFESTSWHWELLENQKDCVDWLSQQIGICCMDDWYKIKTDDIIRLKCNGLIMEYYEGWISDLLCTTYPHHQWHPWIFTVERNRWHERYEYHRPFLDWIAEKHNIGHLDDWY